MTDINLCSTAQEGQEKEINLCPDEPAEQDKEINLCPADCPPELPELFLTGPAEPISGDTYTASGGVEPYVFSTTCGMISSIGVLTGIDDCCGTGNVSVADKCGQSKTVAVDFGEILTLVAENYEIQTDHLVQAGGTTYAPHRGVVYDSGGACINIIAYRTIDNTERSFHHCFISIPGYAREKNYYLEITAAWSVFVPNFHRWRVRYNVYEISPCA